MKKVQKKKDNELKAWDIVTQVLLMLKKNAVVGMPLLLLDDMAAKLITELGGESINKGYTMKGLDPFPGTVCISINAVIAHGMPSPYKLQDGDLVSFDLGVRKNGICGDAALTVPVGNVKKADLDLLDATRHALYKGIDMCRPGVAIRDIGFAIETYALKRGYVVNHSLCGHTIGKEMHMLPNILHFYDPATPGVLEEGQMICLEPMLTLKDHLGVKAGWMFITRDGRNSAVFEHQILIVKNGYEVLTSHI